MFSFRLKIFHSVATLLSFTKASEELFISQPAVTKSIKELESELGIGLFKRKGSKIELTEAGSILLNHTNQILSIECKINYEISLLKNEYTGNLKIGASTTIGQYVLPPLLALFNKKYPDIKLSLSNNNTQVIEKSLIDGFIDIGIVEGNSKNKQLKYIPFLKDEIVAIAHTSQKLSHLDELSIDEFMSTPLVLREIGSGSLEVITDKLKDHNIKLKDLSVVMNLGSTESIKSFLANSNSLGLISINAISHEVAEGKFKIIDIKGIDFERFFYFIHLHGNETGFSNTFMNFAQHHYNQKL